MQCELYLCVLLCENYIYNCDVQLDYPTAYYPSFNCETKIYSSKPEFLSWLLIELWAFDFVRNPHKSWEMWEALKKNLDDDSKEKKHFGGNLNDKGQKAMWTLDEPSFLYSLLRSGPSKQTWLKNKNKYDIDDLCESWPRKPQSSAY